MIGKMYHRSNPIEWLRVDGAPPTASAACAGERVELCFDLVVTPPAPSRVDQVSLN